MRFKGRPTGGLEVRRLPYRGLAKFINATERELDIELVDISHRAARIGETDYRDFARFERCEPNVCLSVTLRIRCDKAAKDKTSEPYARAFPW